MNACPMSGKGIYASKSAALRVVACLCKRRGKQLTWAKGRLAAYACPCCKGWHVGHEVRA